MTPRDSSNRSDQLHPSVTAVDRATTAALRRVPAAPVPARRTSGLQIDDDRGSQTAEYAMVGGVAAAAAAALITIITKGGFIKMLVSLITKLLAEFISKWF